jgi:hypothetical protein
MYTVGGRVNTPSDPGVAASPGLARLWRRAPPTVERETTMTDPVEEFFNGLAQRGYEPLLQHSTGSIRFDLQDGAVADHWRVTIDHGKVSVGHDDLTADTVVTEDRATFADAVQHRQSMMISILLGQVGLAGNIERLVTFARLFGRQPEMANAQAARR